MTMIIVDRAFAAKLRAEREMADGNNYDEVWDGVYIVSPFPNNEHQEIATLLCFAFVSLVSIPGMGIVYDGVNVSDREEGWRLNYRVPDAGVFLRGNPAKDCGTHWCGGPDFAVEILSPHDMAREKLPFYAAIGVRELLIIGRDPWTLELYRLDAGELTLVAQSSLDQSEVITSAVLPLALRLVAGPDAERPRIEVTGTDGPEHWLV